MSVFKRTIDCDETADVMSTHRCKVWGIHAINKAATVRYLKLYSTPAPIIGTTVPVATLLVPASTDGTGFVWPLHGVNFPTGCAIACVTGVADSDTTGAGTNEVTVTMEIEHY